MLLFLLGVLRKLRLDRLASQAGGANGVEFVAQDSDNFGGHCVVQESDGVLHFALIVLRDRAFGKVLPSPATNFLDIGEKLI